VAACIVLVVVLVLEGVAADEGMDTQRLEGSRFGAHLVTLATFVITLIQPKRAKSSGSRERLLASQLYRLRYDLETEKPALDPTIRWVLKHFLGVGQAFRERGRERLKRQRAPYLLQPSLTKSRFLARYERPEKKVNATATERTNVPIPVAMFWAVGDR
jgi:hypothetical protein